MSKSDTAAAAAKGRDMVKKKLASLGAQDIREQTQGRRIYITARNSNRTKQFRILSKTRRVGSWQASTTDAEACAEKKDETNFWVFVDMETSKPDADFYIMPEWWIKNNIYTVHQAYLARHGGTRKKNPNSNHHSVKWDRINEWFNRWDLLRIQDN
jgi:hypothetical protein